ncbi:MAG: PRC-barrel domain-containing protein, partial [Chloroflexota bacterium]|nr:PRC-barrel domain-containing protein [Chloroflexota bacterium]
VLAGLGGPNDGDAGYAATTDLSSSGLLRTLLEFGFSHDEATYLEHRLAAGVTLIAVTTNDPAGLQTTRRLFADHDAVHIGLAQTDARFFQEAEALLNAPPEASSGGEVVVTDAVAPLRHVGTDGGSPVAAALRQRGVVDETGEEVGKIEDVLEDEAGPGGGNTHRTIRYLVVGFGGVLGLGRHRVAVPASFADLQSNPIRLTLEKDVLQRAPKFDEDAPFSRREERTVCAYFGCDPYWLAN